MTKEAFDKIAEGLREAASVAGSHGDRVRLSILEMGMRLWRVDPSYVSARRIAHELDMTHGAILYHFGTSMKLRDAIAFHAVRQGESKVIVHLIASKHPAVSHMPDAERMDHMRFAG